MLNRIKKLCKEKNVGYKELSKLTGISISTLSKIMAGITRDPSITSINKIAHALGVTLDYLVYGENSAIENGVPEIIHKYNSLNSTGKAKADEYITDLSEQKKYTVADADPLVKDIISTAAAEAQTIHSSEHR